MENLKLETKDNIKIEINYFKGGFDSVIVIAPGGDDKRFKSVF